MCSRRVRSPESPGSGQVLTTASRFGRFCWPTPMNLHFVGVGSVGGLLAFFTKRALRVEAVQRFRSPGAYAFGESTVVLHLNRPPPAAARGADGTAVVTYENAAGDVEREEGFAVEIPEQERTSTIDVLVIALKSDLTLSVVGPLVQRFRKQNHPDGPSTVVFLQNGVGNDEQFLTHFFAREGGAEAVARPFVLLNSNSHGTGRKAPLWVRHVGYNTFHFGLPRETAARVGGGGEAAVFRHWQDPAHEAPRGTQTLMDMIQLLASRPLAAPALPHCTLETGDRFALRALQKLVVNCCANAIGAVYGVANGAVLDRPELNALRQAVTAECAHVLCIRWLAEHPGTVEADVPDEIQLDALHDAVYTLIDRNRINKVSMLQDIDSGRGATEIDLLNGTVAAWGRKYGVPTPLNDTLIAQVKERAQTSGK